VNDSIFIVSPYIGDILKMDEFDEKTDFYQKLDEYYSDIGLVKFIYGCLMG